MGGREERRHVAVEDEPSLKSGELFKIAFWTLFFKRDEVAHERGGDPEAVERLVAVYKCRRVHRLVQECLRRLLHGLRKLVEHVRDLVHPAALLSSLGEHLTNRGPEAERVVADSDDRRS